MNDPKVMVTQLWSGAKTVTVADKIIAAVICCFARWALVFRDIIHASGSFL